MWDRSLRSRWTAGGSGGSERLQGRSLAGLGWQPWPLSSMSPRCPRTRGKCSGLDGPPQGEAGCGVRPGQPQPGPPPTSPSSREPSPYDESEMHQSFHLLIQEQSQGAAEEGLELQPQGPGTGAAGASGEPAWLRPRPGRGWGWGFGEEVAVLWTRLSAPQPATSRPCWGPRAPLRTAWPRSASWPACPAAPSVSGPCPPPWHGPQPRGRVGLSGHLCPAEQALSAPLRPPVHCPSPARPAASRVVPGIKIGSRGASS